MCATDDEYSHSPGSIPLILKSKPSSKNTLYDSVTSLANVRFTCSGPSAKNEKPEPNPSPYEPASYVACTAGLGARLSASGPWTMMGVFGGPRALGMLKVWRLIAKWPGTWGDIDHDLNGLWPLGNRSEKLDESVALLSLAMSRADTDRSVSPRHDANTWRRRPIAEMIRESDGFGGVLGRFEQVLCSPS